MVTSWLLNSLYKNIAYSVIYSRTTKDLWTDLEQRFCQSNGAKLCHLQKKSIDLAQGSTDIAGYFTRIQRLWDELDSLNSHINCTYVCTCDEKQRTTKSLDDQRLIQFLIWLNDVYSQARGNIFILDPPPGINHAYSLLLQDENQREVYVNSHISTNSSSFMVDHYYTTGQKLAKQLPHKYENKDWLNNPYRNMKMPHRKLNLSIKSKDKGSDLELNNIREVVSNKRKLSIILVWVVHTV